MTKIDTYTSIYNEAICPHCGDAREYDSESLPWGEDEQTEIECDSCDKEYSITCYIMYSRESFKIDCKNGKHNLGEIEEGVSQELADKWNREKFLEQNNWEPTKIRKCLDCENQEDCEVIETK